MKLRFRLSKGGGLPPLNPQLRPNATRRPERFPGLSLEALELVERGLRPV